MLLRPGTGHSLDLLTFPLLLLQLARLLNCSLFSPPQFLGNFCIISSSHVHVFFKSWLSGTEGRGWNQPGRVKRVEKGALLLWRRGDRFRGSWLAANQRTRPKGAEPRGLHFPEASWAASCFPLPVHWAVPAWGWQGG